MPHYKIIVHGIVQNVNFRHNITMFANKLGISGCIHNLSDETVEIYFIGNEILLEKFNNFIESSPGNSKVDKIVLKNVKEVKKFEKFQILY